MNDADRDKLTEAWPLFGLSIRTAKLELRLPTDDEVLELLEVAKSGIHNADFMPFAVPWTDKESPEFERSFLQHHWLRRADWTSSTWALNMVVSVDGKIVGTQSLMAEDFATRRIVVTGSWIGREFQGNGIGTEMRIAVLHFIFEYLGADYAVSDAFIDNGPSLGVSAKLGYESNGFDIVKRRDGSERIEKLIISREVWEDHPLRQRNDIVVEGFDVCRELFGLTD